MPTSTHADCTFFTEIFGKFVTFIGPTESSAPTAHIGALSPCRGGRLCPPAGCSCFYGNLRRMRTRFPPACRGRCPHRPTQKTPFLRKSTANSELPRGPMWASAPTWKYGNACGFAERLSEMRKPPLAAPRAGRGGGIFVENDGGDLLQDSECSGICGVRIPSGPSGQLPLCPRGALGRRSVLRFAHAFSGHEQDHRADGQQAADDVEDCRADAAGGGKLRAGLVFDLDIACRRAIFHGGRHGAC